MMGKIKGIELLKNGKRLDGRMPLEMREIEMKVGVIPNANGSAMVRFGKTIAVAAVYGPRLLLPKHLQENDRAVVQCRYNMAPFSTDERVKPGPTRREIEISKVIRQAVEPVLFLENYPKTTIDIFIEILQADGSTRVTSINATSLALADAGVPMKDLVVALSGGKINGTLILDLNGLEDNNSEADMPVAFTANKKEITLLQMDGELTKEEIKKLLKEISTAGEKIYQMQIKALKDRYSE
ncbi:MAG: exosome complex exonuclease Rrp41 [Candidatus Aenigmarchaeota archaeon]|nr:exosome complex exonuclease Rrp41 [Candidatus Aenigmarchaeota archaeon]